MDGRFWRRGMAVTFAFLALVAVLPAQQPTVSLSLRGIDALIDDVDFVGGEIGQEGTRDTAEGFLSAVTEGGGLMGVDRDKPLGAYWFADPINPPQMPVIYIPVSDADDLKELLGKLTPDFEEEDGLLSMTVNGMKVFGKIQNDYVFLSLAPDTLEKPLNPAKLTGRTDLALTVNIAGIPEELRQAFVQQLEQSAMQQLENSPEPASEAERAGREMGAKGALEVFRALALEAEVLSFGFDIDQPKRKIAYDLGVTAIADTRLGAAMNEYGKIKPVYAGLGSDTALLRLLVSYPTSGIKDNVDSVITMMKDSIFKEIAADKKLKTDADRKAAQGIATRILGVISATLKSGAMHSGVVVEPAEDDEVKVIMASRIAQAAEAQKVFDDVVKMARNTPEFKKLTLDVAKQGATRIHAVESNADQSPLGDEPFHFCISNDSIWMSMGSDNLNFLQQALGQSARVSTRKPAPISLIVKPAALISLGENVEEDMLERANDVKELPGDRLQLEVVPVPNGARMQLEFGVDLLKLARQP